MRQLLSLLAGAWLLAGCAGSNVNPSQARAGTGYVDFYTIAGGDLNWEVARWDAGPQRYQIIFSELQPLPDGVLRLALPPGKHRLRVTILNRIVREPSAFGADVVAGMIIPVHVVLTEDGVTEVQGRDGQEISRYRISTVVNAPVPYRVKAEMPYAY
jgi:hypothetical protein